MPMADSPRSTLLRLFREIAINQGVGWLKATLTAERVELASELSDDALRRLTTDTD